ncbi:MAG TPA: LamG domain-containing protein, partial [Candidatus Binatia bacterium]|nr:LamG domain-containing protein [Candidatus Binatia bacterium]
MKRGEALIGLQSYKSVPSSLAVRFDHLYASAISSSAAARKHYLALRDVYEKILRSDALPAVKNFAFQRVREVFERSQIAPRPPRWLLPLTLAILLAIVLIARPQITGFLALGTKTLSEPLALDSSGSLTLKGVPDSLAFDGAWTGDGGKVYVTFEDGTKLLAVDTSALTDGTFAEACVDTCALSSASKHVSVEFEPADGATITLDRVTYTTEENNPPEWVGDSIIFNVNDTFTLDLNNLFFDIDGDKLTFTAAAPQLVTATVDNNELTISVDSSFEQGVVDLTAFDGLASASKSLVIRGPLYASFIENLTNATNIAGNLTNLTNETINVTITDKHGKELASYSPKFKSESYTADLKVKKSKKRDWRADSDITFVGLKKHVHAVLDDFPGLGTPVFAAENVVLDQATITLPKSGAVTDIVECPDFDTAHFTCPSSFVRTSIPFTDNGNSVTFTVTHFSGYGGASFGISSANVTQVILNSTNPLTNDSRQNLTLYPVLGTTDAYTTNITDWRLSNGTNFTSIALLNMPFETNTTSTSTGAIRDYSTYANNGTLAGNTGWNNSGKPGGYYTFPGAAAGKISISDNDYWTFPGNFTLVAWVNFNGTQCGNWWECAILAHDAGSGTVPKWIWSYDTSVSKTILHAQTAGASLYGNAWTITSGVWYQLALTRNGTLFTFYRNGIADGTATSSFSFSNPAASLTIGFGEGSGSGFKGFIDEVLILNRSLSPEQVNQLYLDTNSSKHSTVLHSNETRVGETWQACV